MKHKFISEYDQRVVYIFKPPSRNICILLSYMQDGSCVRNAQCFPDWKECPHIQVNAVRPLPKLQATKAQGDLESNPDVTYTSLSQQDEINLVPSLSTPSCQDDGYKGMTHTRNLTRFSPRRNRSTYEIKLSSGFRGPFHNVKFAVPTVDLNLIGRTGLELFF